MVFGWHAFNVHSVTWQEVTFTVFWKQRMVSDLVLLPLLGSPCHSLLAWSIGTGYRAQCFGQILMETLAKRCSYKKSEKVFTAGGQKFLLWHLPAFFFKCAWREYDSKDHTVCKTHKKWDDRREPCQSIDTFFLNPREDYLTDKTTAAGPTNVCHMVHDESRPPGCGNGLVLVIFTLLVLLYIIYHIFISSSLFVWLLAK